MTMLDSHLLSPAGLASAVVIVLSSAVLYALGTVVYNLFFSPVRHIPGPWLAAATGIPYALHTRSGTIVEWIHELHKTYGEVVRVAPTELSFISGETAWPDIYGFRTGKHKNTGAFLKDKTWYPPSQNGASNIINSDEADHTRFRRNLSHAFSGQALRAQEPLVMGYVELLINRLLSHAELGNEIDIMRWYNYATFDIIADLCFGEPLYCLRDSEAHQWVNLTFKSLKAIPTIATRHKYILFRMLDRARGFFSDTQADLNARKDFFSKASERVSLRLEKETDRPDFFTFILDNQGKENRALLRPEMDTNAFIFLIAGSETTATTLSGATYLLLRNPAVYKRLVTEIRSTFSSSKDITMEAVDKLPYLIAVLQEGLRYYPPVPTGFPRVVPGQGQVLSGHYVPGGTSVYVSQHATNHSPRNYTDPDEYVPERWLEDERPAKYADDKREVTQPFSFGPRNCLGKNLAYAEMRLILAKVLWHFDLKLVHPEKEWMKGQKVFALWDKGSLDVKLTPVKREE